MGVRQSQISLIRYNLVFPDSLRRINLQGLCQTNEYSNLLIFK